MNASPQIDGVDAGQSLAALFEIAGASDTPTAAVLVGQPGASPGRAVAFASEGFADTPALLSVRRLRGVLAAAPSPAWSVADSMGAALRVAREKSYSVVFDATDLGTEMADHALRAFRAADFSTRLVVVAARRSESLLAVVSSHLLLPSAPERLLPVAAHDAELDAVRRLIAAASEVDYANRLTILSGDGRVMLDAGRSEPNQLGEAGAIYEATLSEPMSAREGAQWFGELRRITDHVLSSQRRDPDVVRALIQLHEIALREVIPSLPLRPGSPVVAEQTRRMTIELSALRRVLSGERVPTAGPSPAPGIGRAGSGLER